MTPAQLLAAVRPPTSCPAAAPSPPHAAIEVRGLTASHAGRPAVWDVDARFPVAQLSAIVGPNGAGKSTLLRAILVLHPADAGHVLVDGVPGPAARDRVAYVPQRECVDWDFPITVREVVEMGRYRHVGPFRRLRGADRAVVDDSLERVGMDPFARRQVGALSGGQRQRVFLARALAQRPPVLLLDEPFAGVDACTEAALLAVLHGLRDAGRCVVMVHHDLSTVRRCADRALLLNVRAVASGPVAEVLAPARLERAYGAGVPCPA